MTFSLIRTLTPSTMSAFSATARAATSTWRIVDVVQLGHREPRQPGDGDVHERELPRARTRHDEAAEAGQVVGAGVARRDHGGGALVGGQFVGGNADR